MGKLIERDAAVEVLNQLAREHFSLSDGFQFYIDALKDVELNVMALPTVDAVPVRHGRWKWNGEAFICSACGNGHKGQPTIMGHPMFEFCPMCGADMRKDGDGNG